MPEGPIRETFINIPQWAEVALYLGSVVSVAVLAWVRTNVPQGIKQVLVYVFGQRRLVRKAYAGTMHVGLFWGFVLLFIGTALATIDWDFTRPFNMRILQAAFYLGYELV